MAEYRAVPAAKRNVKKNDKVVWDFAKQYGGSTGQEGALLNGLLALGYDPALVRSFADADPNRRYLDDAITRALRAGISEADIDKALRATRAAASGDPQGAIAALGVDPNQLPPDSRAVFDSIANRQPLPFLDRGQTAPAPAPTGGDFRDQRSGSTAPPQPAAPAPAAPPPPGRTPGPAGGLGAGGGNRTVTAPASAGLRNLPTLAANAPEGDVIAYIRKYYGYASWVLDIPELRQRMIEVARDFAGVPVDEATIMGRFTDLDWWKTHSDQQRLAIEEQAADPATYNAKVEGKFRELGSLTGQLGFQVPEARLRHIAKEAYDQGWNTAEMRSALAAEFDYNPVTGDEDQSRIVADLRQLASDYLVPLGEQTIDQWGRQIVAGTSTNEDFTAYAKSMAKGMFAHYASDIDAGRTVKQIADPFVQMAARDLELTTDQIDLMDAKWRKALEVDPETGQPMQLSKWQRLIRSDSSYGWNYTQNARAEASEFGAKIAEAFGRA